MINVLPPKTAEEVVAREKERKARTTLLMALLEDHLAKFHKMANAKEMWEAIKSRFSRNDESKMLQKYLLKQLFEGFSVSASKGLHKGYDRFQTLLSQLEIRGAGVSNEDANQKFLRVFERDVKGTTTSLSNTQNMAFVSTDNTSSTNDINYDDIQEMDLKWQMAMISMRIKKFDKRTRRKLQFDTKDPVELKGTKTAKEEMLGTMETKLETMVEDIDIRMIQKLCGEDIDWSGHVKKDAQNYAMMAYSSNNSVSDNEVKSCSTTCEESYAGLKKLYDKQRDKLGDASVEITANTLALKKDDPHRALKDKGIDDSGCSRHMTGNKAHLAEYQEFMGGSVAFGGSNGRITGKGKIRMYIMWKS
nr:ribonuclease H-like domain-containing protein [Tanacetum cinerariifolium]